MYLGRKGKQSRTEKQKRATVGENQEKKAHADDANN